VNTATTEDTRAATTPDPPMPAAVRLAWLRLANVTGQDAEIAVNPATVAYLLPGTSKGTTRVGLTTDGEWVVVGTLAFVTHRIQHPEEPH
jgi:hypothetical protein